MSNLLLNLTGPASAQQNTINTTAHPMFHRFTPPLGPRHNKNAHYMYHLVEPKRQERDQVEHGSNATSNATRSDAAPSTKQRSTQQRSTTRSTQHAATQHAATCIVDTKHRAQSCRAHTRTHEVQSTNDNAIAAHYYQREWGVSAMGVWQRGQKRCQGGRRGC